MKAISDWLNRLFSDPQALALGGLLVVTTGIVLIMGRMLIPVIAGLVLAYLLEGLVQRLENRGLPRWLAVAIVFTLFFAFFLFLMFGLAPLLYRQLTQLVQQLPNIVAKGQVGLAQLPDRFPELITETQVAEINIYVRGQIANLGQRILSYSLSSVVGVITVLIYVILVPLLVFFFLKDKYPILTWFARFLPSDFSLAAKVWKDVDAQTGNYVRGKFWEILIVWAVSAATFTVMGLDFAMLLGLMVGVSVVVPYIGAAFVTLPVGIIAYAQWGWGPDFMWLMLAYGIIQLLDGNVLVPLLFSEAVNLHPIAIIVAVLVFGGLWGFWGVFFAIPLATVVQAVINAWPVGKAHGAPETAEI